MLHLRLDGETDTGQGGVGLEVSHGPGPKVGKLRPGLVGQRSVMQTGPDMGKQAGQGWGEEPVKSLIGKLRPSLG